MPSRSHTYSFTMDGTITIDQLGEELGKAAAIMGGTAKIKIRSTDDQRDGYSLHATVTGPTP